MINNNYNNNNNNKINLNNYICSNNNYSSVLFAPEHYCENITLCTDHTEPTLET